MVLENVVGEVIKEYFQLESGEDYDVTPIKGGMSGAEVFLLRVKRPREAGKTGCYILKVINTEGRSEGMKDYEALQIEKIRQLSEAFSEHLVERCHYEVRGDRLIIVSSYAFHTELNSISFSKKKWDREKCGTIRAISYDLLNAFNTDNIELHQSGIIQGLCKGRIEEGGNFPKRVRNILADPDAPGINMEGMIFPNPLHYLDQLRELVESKKYSFLYGKIHGDLHQDNILVKKEGGNEGKDYVIVDYDSFESNFLLFDQAYMELNSYSAKLRKKDMAAWAKAMKYVLGRDIEERCREEGKFHSAGKIRNAVVDGVVGWFREKMPQAMDICRIQLQIARFCAGINFLSKRNLEDERELQIKYFIYTAINLKILFADLNIDWDRNHTTSIRCLTDEQVFDDRLEELCGRLKSGDLEENSAEIKPEEALYIAYAYQKGVKDIPENEEKMKFWLVKAAGTGEEEAVQIAANCLGDMSFRRAVSSDGEKKRRELAESARWYARSALGSTYLEKSAPEDWKNGKLCGNHWGIYNLGCAWYYGYGVETDLAEAQRCFRAAADRRNPLAERMVKYLAGAAWQAALGK